MVVGERWTEEAGVLSEVPEFRSRSSHSGLWKGVRVLSDLQGEALAGSHAEGDRLYFTLYKTPQLLREDRPERNKSGLSQTSTWCGLVALLDQRTFFLGLRNVLAFYLCFLPSDISLFCVSERLSTYVVRHLFYFFSLFFHSIF